MSKNFKVFAITFGTMSVLFLGFLGFSANNSSKNNLSYDFTGKVQVITYDTKGIPTVTINGKEYYLSAGYNFNSQIEKNDSLKKRKMSATYILIKQKTGKIIAFNN